MALPIVGVSVPDFETSQSGSNAVCSNGDSSGESEVMMRRKREKKVCQKGRMKEIEEKRSENDNLILISDSDEEELEKSGALSHGISRLVLSEDQSAKERKKRKESESEIFYTKKQKNNEREKKEKKENKGKEKMTNHSESVCIRKEISNKEQENVEKINEEEKEKKGKEKQTESVSATKQKRREEESRAKSESVQTGWDTHMRESERREKKRKRRQNTLQLCPAHRTRSFSMKDPKKVDYTPFYYKVNVDADEVVYDLDSDSDSDSESDSELGLGGLNMICEEEESDSDSDWYTVSYSDFYPELASFDKEERGQGSKGKSDRERNKYGKSETRRKSHERRRREKISSESDSDEWDRQEKKERKKYKAGGPQQNEKSNSERKKRRKRKKSAKVAGRKNLMEYLMSNMNEDEKEEIPECSRRGNSPQELPLVFQWGSSDEESNGSEDPLEEMWKDYDFALGLANLGTYNANQEKDKNEEFYKGNGDFCQNGDHDMYLDEQIGYRCLLCSYIETEIRYVMPAFAKNAHGAATQPENRTSINDLLNLSLDDPSNLHKPGPSRTKTGTVWDLIPGIFQTLYPHQKEAFAFMWQNLAGSTQLDSIQLYGLTSESDQVGGCVVSHAPGTGKTRLAIVFTESYMRAFPGSKPVVIAPAGMMLTWENEFAKWGFAFPFHNMNSEDFTGKEDVKLVQLIRGEPRSKDLVRKIKLCSWAKGNCVLGISYSLFSKYLSHISKRESKERELLIEKSGLLILDEGHIPRNDKSLLWKAFSEVKSDKRIILSGTPFQNNFLELYNSLCIVRPKFAQKVDVTKVGRKRKLGEKRDVWAATTENITDEMVDQVRSVLMPFVHVHAGSILRSLPGLRECVIMLRPEPIQSEILEKFIGHLRNYGTLETDHRMSLASVHPFLLTTVSNLSETEKEVLNVSMLKTLKKDPYEGVKTKFVVEFVRLCAALKERVLIFSQYLEPLKLIRKHLMLVFNWMEGTEVLQIYGQTHPNVRQGVINEFNDISSEARVLLASTKACSEGISLTGASRVVMLDVVWNPSVGKQAISRAFRIGQDKVVYTYNLITTGTREIEKYDVQGKKEMLSKLVFAPKCEGGLSKKEEGFLKGWSEKDGEACKMVSDDLVLEEITANEKLKDIFENIFYIKSDELHD